VRNAVPLVGRLDLGQERLQALRVAQETQDLGIGQPLVALGRGEGLPEHGQRLLRVAEDDRRARIVFEDPIHGRLDPLARQGM